MYGTSETAKCYAKYYARRCGVQTSKVTLHPIFPPNFSPVILAKPGQLDVSGFWYPIHAHQLHEELTTSSLSRAQVPLLPVFTSIGIVR